MPAAGRFYWHLETNYMLMKNQEIKKGNRNVQGKPTSDRAFHNPKEDKKIQGISNGGGQRSDQTSNKDNERKREK